jgi:hypothetical protein
LDIHAKEDMVKKTKIKNKIDKKKMLCILFGSKNLPSTKYRFYNYKKELEKNYKITIGSNLFDLLRHGFYADLIFIQKKLINSFFWIFISPFLKAKIIYDFDDAIYTSAGKNWSIWTKFKVAKRFKLTLASSDLVLCPSNFLATEAKKHTRKVIVFPMSVREPRFRITLKKKFFTFGWAGHPQSLSLLRNIADQINSFQKETGITDFLLLSGNEDPKLNFSYQWIPYNLENERFFFRSVKVGLSPSRNTIFDMGKSPIKIIQHFSHSKTVLTNNRGAAEDFINTNNSFIAGESKDSWKNLMKIIVKSPSEIKIRSRNAYLTYQSKFNLKKNKIEFLRLIKNA